MPSGTPQLCCVLMYCTSRLQERILKGEYGEEGEHFTYSYGLVFMNRFLGLIFSGVMLHYTRPKWWVLCDLKQQQGCMNVVQRGRHSWRG